MLKMLNLTIKYLQDLNYNIDTEFYNLYQSHPNYPSLLAVSEGLNSLKIENISANVPFQHFDKLPNKFITQLNNTNDFLLLSKNNNTFTIQSDKAKSKSITIDEIQKNWNGFVFLIDENITKKTSVGLPYMKIIYGLIMLFLYVLKSNFNNQNIFYLITTLFGLYFSNEILNTYFKKNGNESKFCSANKEVSCNSVINSNKFKFSKYIEFADLPILFFSISLFGVLFNLFTSNYIGILSLFSIPIVLYSIYLQKKVIKKWCTLCLIISSILIFNGLFFINLKFEFTEILNFIIVTLTIVPIWFLIKKNVKNNLDKTQENNKLLRFKRSEKVFEAVAENINSLEEINFITIGNPNAKNVLTLFITPSCSFCHIAIKDALQLLEKYENTVCLKIAYNLNINNLDNPYIKIAKIITSLFINKLDYIQSIRDWHIEKLDPKLWFIKWEFDDNFVFENELLDKQFNWCLEQEFNYAPVKIFNNKLLSDDYEIKELHYFFIE